MAIRSIVTAAAVAIGLSAFATAPAVADDASGTQQPTKAKDDPSRRICKTIIPTGSRMTSRVCRTRAQWEASMDKTQDGVLHHQTTRESGLEHQAGGL
jgi:hypothetical protein